MPASNRRPLYDDADAPSQQYPVSNQPPGPQELLPAPTAAPAAASQQTPTFKQPCTLKGAASAMYAGALGYFLGFVPATIKFKAKQWGMIHTQGLASAQQLAVMSGMYTAVHCICQRIRMVEDGWNRGIAGCSTGLVLGWSNGPWAAMQSCAGLGLISALIDLGGGLEAAEARELHPSPLGHHQQKQQKQQQQQRGGKHQHSPMHKLPSSQHDQQQQQQLAADHGPLLQGLPQPAQLLALLLGVAPHSLTSSAAAAATTEQQGALRTAALQPPPPQQQQQQPTKQQQSRRRQKQQQQVNSSARQESSHAASQADTGVSTRSRQQQHQILQPAVDAARHLLLSAPPLVFLGACCHSSTATGVGVSKAAAADAAADVDGCLLMPAAASGATAAAAVTAGRRRA